MFKDYYAILKVSENASQEEIKSAYKLQAIKWHPDKNIKIDTTLKMQEINEAFLILKDFEARERYNKEYYRFNQFQKEKDQYEQAYRKQGDWNYNDEFQKNQYQYSEYNIYDDILNKWINNARKQAVDLAKETIEDFKDMVSIGVKEAAKGAGKQFINQIIVGLIFLLIFALIKGCDI